MEQPESQPMSLRQWRALAEHKIEAAIREGAFDNLPGFGQPLPDWDARDENWWLKQKCREEGVEVLPPALELKRDVERALQGLQRDWSRVEVEQEVRQALEAINAMIRKRNESIGWGPPSDVQPLEVERWIERWRDSRAD